MNGYIMFNKILEAHMVEQPHKDIFKNSHEFKFIPHQKKFIRVKNEQKSTEELKARVTGLLEKEKEKRIRLKELQIEYDFPGYQAIVDEVKTAMKKTNQ